MNKNLSRGCIYIFIFGFVFLTLPLKFAFGEIDHLIITEVQIEGETTHNDFIEIYNPTNSEINISSFQIRKKTQSAKNDQGELILEFPEGAKLKAKNYILWANSEDGYANSINADFSNEKIISPNNSIALLDNSGKTLAERKIIDAVGWGEGNQYSFIEGSFLLPAAGQKLKNLQRKQIDGIYQDTDNNVNDFEINEKPSPMGGGLVTSTSEELLPLSANAGDDVISTTGTEITFDASASTGNIEEYYWNFGDGQTKTGKVVTHKYQYPGEYLVYLRVSNGEEKNTNSIQVQIFSSEIFISEFLPNPKGNDSNQEWIEIVNESKEVQNITGWGIGNKAEKATFVFPEGTYLTPNGLLLLSSSLTKISLLNDAGSLFLFYPSGDLCQEVKYENPGENVSIARENGDYFYTQNPTPGMKNIISNHSSENKISSLSQAQIQNQTQNPSSASNFISVSAFTPSNSVLNSTNFSNSINSSSNSNNDDDDSNSSSILNQNSSTILGSSSEKNKNNENVEKKKDSLLSSFLTSDLLVKVKGNKNKIILAIMGVVLCSGFLAIYLVRLRRKIKEKSDNSVNNTNLEKIKVEIEK